MKKAIIDGMCCKGCANEVKNIFEHIYGVSNVKISDDNSFVTYEGYVSKRIVQEALAKTNYELVKIEKFEK
ncbi:MAG: heavy-metal-associated domain-containing protein [Tenericutes bacterium]|nr:heavy-metal-associated domain-containing protein [Mycoplasmatota bacterium]